MYAVNEGEIISCDVLQIVASTNVRCAWARLFINHSFTRIAIRAASPRFHVAISLDMSSLVVSRKGCQNDVFRYGLVEAMLFLSKGRVVGERCHGSNTPEGSALHDLLPSLDSSSVM